MCESHGLRSRSTPAWRGGRRLRCQYCPRGWGSSRTGRRFAASLMFQLYRGHAFRQATGILWQTKSSTTTVGKIKHQVSTMAFAGSSATHDAKTDSMHVLQADDKTLDGQLRRPTDGRRVIVHNAFCGHTLEVQHIVFSATTSFDLFSGMAWRCGTFPNTYIKLVRSNHLQDRILSHESDVFNISMVSSQITAVLSVSQRRI